LAKEDVRGNVAKVSSTSTDAKTRYKLSKVNVEDVSIGSINMDPDMADRSKRGEPQQHGECQVIRIFERQTDPSKEKEGFFWTEAIDYAANPFQNDPCAVLSVALSRVKRKS